PPNMKKDTGKLEALLALLPRPGRAAFELRHASWFDDEIFELLRARNAALCWSDIDDKTMPWVATADWGYVRLRRTQYDGRALGAWTRRIRESKWRSTWVYFKHEDTGTGPAYARKLIDRLG